MVIVVEQKRYLAGLQVDLDQIDRTHVPEQRKGAADIDTHEGKAFAEDRAMKRQVVHAIELADTEFAVAEQSVVQNAVSVGHREECALTGGPCLCGAAEEEARISLQSRREFAVRAPPLEVGEGEVD